MACCDLLECSICFSAFENPHILPRCGHTFCLSCIQNLRDSRCPICRQVFDRRNVRPNFVLQQLMAEGTHPWQAAHPHKTWPDDAQAQRHLRPSGLTSAHNSTSSVARPSHPSISGHDEHHASTQQVAAAYGRLGVPPKLADVLAEEDADIALRVYILDNSGSMAKGDGHVMQGEAQGRMRSVPATRWEEVKAMALHHADWNAQLGVPCEFILLNSPNPARPRDGVDFVRVDEDLGSVVNQRQCLADLLARTRPSHGTPLTERLQHLLFRLRGNARELEAHGQKVMITIVTDGAPNGSRANFVQALRQLTREVPAYLVIRLCTDDDDVTQFYDDIDKEVELSLDIVDDLHGEAKNVYQMNPWLTYTPVLQTVREAGTLSKILDLVDERPLLPMEVAILTQLLLRPATTIQCPRHPENFLSAVEKELACARPVFCGRRQCMASPLQLPALRAAVLPQKYSALGQVAHAVGMGQVADWWFTGKNPFQVTAEEEVDKVDDEIQADVLGRAAPTVHSALFAVGQQVEYYSTTKRIWFACTIMHLDSASGAVMVSVKPGHWIAREQQRSCIRLPGANPAATKPAAAAAAAAVAPAPAAPAVVSPAAPAAVAPAAVAPAASPADLFAGAELIEYRSRRFACWLPCMVVQRDAASGSIMTNLKPGEWLTPQEQAQCTRPFDRAAEPAALHVGEQIMFHSRSQGQWLATVVTKINPANRHIEVKARSGAWIDVEQQKYFVRKFVS